MSLPADVARCDGVQYDGIWREGCETCLRRTSRIDHPRVAYMAPPPIVVFECEYLIEPEAQ